MENWHFWQNRRHLWSFLGAMGVYVILMLAVQATLPTLGSSLVAALWAITPALPLAFVVYLTVLQLKALDEFQQRSHILALAITSGICLVAATAYGLLEALLNFPDFPLALAMPVFVAIWWPATVLIKRAYR